MQILRLVPVHLLRSALQEARVQRMQLFWLFHATE
jgi:hypothetical protein